MAEGPLIGQAVEVRARGLVLRGVVCSASGAHILVSLGPLPSGPPELPVESAVKLRYATTLGLHELSSHVVSLGGRDNVTLTVAHSSEGQTIQRRNFYRVSACLSVSVNVAHSATAQGFADARAITQDISAGGMRLETALRAGLGDQLELVVQTPLNFRRSLPPELACRGRVVRILEEALRGERYASLGVEFKFELERERDRWVQLSFDLQRKVQF
jgi:hypothetical protein